MKRLHIALLALACFSLPASAQEQDDKTGALVDQVVAAYGGDALLNISNYEITERYIAPAVGQSWSPELEDIGRINQRFIVETGTGNVYFENWFVGSAGVFPTLTIVNGDKAWAVNLQNNRYGDAASADPYVIAGGAMRTTDTLLARELHKVRDKAEYMGSKQWQNRTHETLKMPFPQSPDLLLYIEAETGLISRMTRDNPQLGALDYVYEDHATEKGITRARRVNFFVAGSPNLLAERHEVRFNQVLPAGLFELPGGMQPEGERSDRSEMLVNRLSDSVYHVGQNIGFSIFVDTGSEIIGCGGYPGLTQRLERFREETGSHLPLRYQVVTHHHSDHLGGIDEALALGATLVTVDDNIETISEASTREPESGRFLSVNERLTLGSGKDRVEIYDVETIHSASNLLFYVPGSRTLFMADHFGSPFEEGVPVATRNTMSMSEALAPLDINVKKIVTAHGSRVFSDRDFEASVKAYRDYDCPDDRPLCSR